MRTQLLGSIFDQNFEQKLFIVTKQLCTFNLFTWIIILPEGDKERRGIDQNNRDLKNKLLANIDEVDENLKNVKTTMAGKIEELESKIIEIDGENKSKLHQLEVSYTSKLHQMEASHESKLVEIEADHRSKLLELEAYNLLMLRWAGTNCKNIEGLGERLLQRIDQKIEDLIQRQDRIFQELEQSRQRESEGVESFKTEAEELIYKVNEVSEKIMDFEKNKRNNLIMFGIPNDSHESPSSLDIKVVIKCVYNKFNQLFSLFSCRKYSETCSSSEKR